MGYRPWGHRESDTTEHTYIAYEKPDKDSSMSDLESHCDFEKHFPLLCNFIFSNYQRVPEGFGLKKLKANDYPGHLKGHSVQFSSVAQPCLTDSLQPNGLQHARLPCPSPIPGVHSNSCPLSSRCHPTISSSLIPYSSCFQSFPASESFEMSQLFASGGQSTGVPASTSVLPMNTQD